MNARVRFDYDRRIMASPLRMTIAGDRLDRATGDDAWSAVSAEFDAVDAAMSRFRSDSAVTRLNETAGSGDAVAVEPRLYWALAASCRAWRLTGGRFDPRILVDLERLGYPGAPIERHAGLTAAAHAGAATWLDRSPRVSTVAIAKPVDLGGIGKGLALRWAARRATTTLRSATGPGYLLDAGGDIVVAGPSPEGGPWSLGIEDPFGGADPIVIVTRTSGALCTSSIRLNRWTTSSGDAAHHLIDPTTGRPGGDGLVSVSVAGPDPAWAEIWSKTLFLVGRAQIREEAAARGLAAWWVADDGELSMTPAGRQITVWP